MDTQVLLDNGHAAYRAGDHRAAIRWWTDALGAGIADAQTRGETMWLVGMRYAELGDGQQAERWFAESAVAGYAFAMNSLADILMTRGDYDTAIGWYSRAIERGPANPELDAIWQCQIGRAHALRGDPASGIQWYKRALKTGMLGGPELRELLEMLAEAYVALGDRDEAIRWYAKAAGVGNAH